MDRSSPEDYQPSLTRWGHAWRFVLMLCLSAVVWTEVAEWLVSEHPTLFVVDFVVGGLCYVAVHFRRRWPVPIALLTAAAGAGSAIAAGPAILAAVSVATRRQWSQILAVAAANVVSVLGFTFWASEVLQEPIWVTIIIDAIAIVAMFGWGMYIGSRRELLWTLRQRAERAEAEQALRVSQARGQERARIAREMHDVLAHRISQISMHAGALSFRHDLDADKLRESAGVIQEQAHQALDDLRGVLGVLRDASWEPLNAPQPTYADIGELVGEATRTGLRVKYDDGLAGPVPDPAGRALYRIVQEGITNASKHAPGARLFITMTGSPTDGISFELSNRLGFADAPTLGMSPPGTSPPVTLMLGTPTPSGLTPVVSIRDASIPGAGLGLVGLAERAALIGGHLEHRRQRDRFYLSGWIPWAP